MALGYDRELSEVQERPGSHTHSPPEAGRCTVISRCQCFLRLIYPLVQL